MYFWEKYPMWNRFRSHTPAGFYHPTKGHSGEDLGTPEGTPLTLPVKAKVVQILQQNEMGLTLYLEVEKKIVVFSHLSKVFVEKGDTVNSDTVFANTGNTGSKTTAPHLHVEVLSQKPQEGYEMMSRSVGGFDGFNIPPTIFFDSLAVQEQTALEWCKKHLREASWEGVSEGEAERFRALARRSKSWFI